MACLFIWEICNKCCKVKQKKKKKKNCSQLKANIYNGINLSFKCPRLWTDLIYLYYKHICFKLAQNSLHSIVI